MRGSSLSTLRPMRSSSASTFERPAWSETRSLRRLPTRLGRHVLVGRGLLHDRGGVDAGLGGERALADIGRVAVGRAVEHLVERVRGMREALELLVRHADVEAVGEFRLELQRRDDRDEIGVAAALAEPVERALDLARAGAHRGERIRHRLLGVVVGVDADMVAGDRLDHLADDRLRPRAAACRRWCRTARPSARPRHRRPWRRRARIADWPCSRRRNARSRAAPRGPWPWRRARCRGSRRGSPRAWSRARRARGSPRTWRRSRWRRPWPRAAPRGRDRSRPSGPGRRVMPKAVKVVCELALLGEQLACRSDWRRDSRPRHSRCRDRRASSAIASLSLSVKSTPLVCAPSRSVVSKR